MTPVISADLPEVYLLKAHMPKQRECLWYPKSSSYNPSKERLILPYLQLITNVTDKRIRFLIIIAGWGMR